LDGLSAIACFPHDSDVGSILKDAPKTASNQNVVIDKEGCNLMIHVF
jgi:hypothetical protein